MIEINVTPMSDKTVDILMPKPQEEQEIDTGYLAGFIRRLSDALDNASAGELEEWAWKSIHKFPSVPSEDDVAELFPPFTMPMPEWVNSP